VLVEALPNSIPLDIDSVLFLDHGKLALGKVFDVIGPVSTPIYCIRFNNHDDITSKGIAVGTKVFCAPRTEYSQFVILSKIMTKGSDASWKNDIEPPENLLEYSDDEAERKNKKKGKANRGNQNPEQREFVRGRRYMVGAQGQLGHGQMGQGQQQPPNLAYPNFSWHMNIPPPPIMHPSNYHPHHQY
jgi:rRNA processing protein Gar1